MSDSFVQTVSLELGLKPSQIEATVALLADGGTVPFIARYRKEATGGLDEVQVLAVRDRLKELAELESRLTAILKSLAERDLLTPDLEKRLRAAGTMARLEDVYLPFRPKKRTRAMIAREKGLEPLALELLAQAAQADPQALALAAIEAGATAASADEALAGARDIIAETISEDEGVRQAMRALFAEEAVVASSVKPGQEEKAQKYLDYFDFSEKLSSIPSHRFLAIRRAEAEGFLSVQALPDQEKALAILRSLFVKNASPSAAEVERALVDSYKRLISLSMETEARQAAKKKADLEAIGIFSKNLRELLMAPALGEKAILAIDPGFRTGCKTVALSPGGILLEHATVQPHASEGEKKLAERKLLELIRKHGIEAVAIGNGTAGRETFAFVRAIEGLPKDLAVELVNESGASIYSASEAAREEFPDLDLTIRGAISIGRRLMDPLAELVKIDPKSIGVGQYQHDVDQSLLRDGLDDVVESCVNKVGVEANTASEKLLSYVSGLGPSLAKNMV
ncbi:MAG: helix-hairpin-helix domain-containing protein, partial [Deltaproteobacteria bacterium]|nr:helix-hairpin-helix domain-containing protein [Deltaproteobacteria bacterium]